MHWAFLQLIWKKLLYLEKAWWYLVGRNKQICYKPGLFEGWMFWISLSINAWRIPWGARQTTVHGVTRVRHDLPTKPPPPWTSLYQIREVKNRFGQSKVSLAPFFSVLCFTFMRLKFLKKMKLVHQRLNYILFSGHQYYWQPSQGYSLDKSSYCLKHEVLDYDPASVTLWLIHGYSITEGKWDFYFIMTLNFWWDKWILLFNLRSLSLVS